MENSEVNNMQKSETPRYNIEVYYNMALQKTAEILRVTKFSFCLLTKLKKSVYFKVEG